MRVFLSPLARRGRLPSRVDDGTRSKVVTPLRGCSMSRSVKADLARVATADRVKSSGTSAAPHQPYYLVIDRRFGVPIFAFLEDDPRGSWPEAVPFSPVLAVTLELAAAPSVPVRGGAGVRSDAAIGRDPERADCFREFRSDRHLRAAGFVLIEPRYVGPTWETYLGVFHPEGARRSQPHGWARTAAVAR